MLLGRLHDARTHCGVNLQLAERVDHFAAFAVVEVGCENDVLLVTRMPGVCDLALTRDDAEKRDEFRRRIGEIPRVPPHSDPERHEQVLLKCFRLVAVDVFRCPWKSSGPVDV